MQLDVTVMPMPAATKLMAEESCGARWEMRGVNPASRQAASTESDRPKL